MTNAINSIKLLMLGFVFLFLFGCTSDVKTSYEPSSSEDLLFSDTTYSTYDLTDLSKEGASIAISSAASTMTGNPAVGIAAGNRVNVFLKCAKDAGVHVIKGYVNNDDPITSGIMAVGEENQNKLLMCLVKAGTSASIAQPASYGFCATSYKLVTPSNKNYYIAFIGTSSKMCQDFCNNNKINCNYDNVWELWVANIQ